MRDISVTFPAGPSGQQALVRFKEPGRKPEFRTLTLGGSVEEGTSEVEAFIWAHLEGETQWQGWLWEA